MYGVWGSFEHNYYPTSKKETYYPSVILHDQNYSLKIVDIPDIPFFPVNSFYNISDLQGKNRMGNSYLPRIQTLEAQRNGSWKG